MIIAHTLMTIDEFPRIIDDCCCLLPYIHYFWWICDCWNNHQWSSDGIHHHLWLNHWIIDLWIWMKLTMDDDSPMIINMIINMVIDDHGWSLVIDGEFSGQFRVNLEPLMMTIGLEYVGPCWKKFGAWNGGFRFVMGGTPSHHPF